VFFFFFFFALFKQRKVGFAVWGVLFPFFFCVASKKVAVAHDEEPARPPPFFFLSSSAALRPALGVRGYDDWASSCLSFFSPFLPGLSDGRRTDMIDGCGISSFLSFHAGLCLPRRIANSALFFCLLGQDAYRNASCPFLPPFHGIRAGKVARFAFLLFFFPSFSLSRTLVRNSSGSAVPFLPPPLPLSQHDHLIARKQVRQAPAAKSYFPPFFFFFFPPPPGLSTLGSEEYRNDRSMLLPFPPPLSPLG